MTLKNQNKIKKIEFHLPPAAETGTAAYQNKYLIRKYKPTAAASSRYIKSQGGQLLYQGCFPSMQKSPLFCYAQATYKILHL